MKTVFFLSLGSGTLALSVLLFSCLSTEGSMLVIEGEHTVAIAAKKGSDTYSGYYLIQKTGGLPEVGEVHNLVYDNDKGDMSLVLETDQGAMTFVVGEDDGIADSTHSIKVDGVGFINPVESFTADDLANHISSIDSTFSAFSAGGEMSSDDCQKKLAKCSSGGCGAKYCSRTLWMVGCEISCSERMVACCGDLFTFGCQCLPRDCCLERSSSIDKPSGDTLAPFEGD